MGTRVLLTAINAYKESPLRGCVNDVLGLREVLAQQHGVEDDQVRMLIDGQATRAAITEGLRWLAEPDADGSEPVRLFHFSGHGTFVADTTGDEPDGRDECIVPVDYAMTGAMSDDTLRELYGSFSKHTHLLLVMDCCHSGSVQRGATRDIRFRFLPNSYEEEVRIDDAARRFQEQRQAFLAESLSDLRDRIVPEDEWQRRIQEAMASFEKKHFGQTRVRGNVVLLAACRDDQTAADAHFGQSYHGAFSFYLTQMLRERGGPRSYRALVEGVGRSLYDNKFRQVPQLQCSSGNRECEFLRLAI